MKSLSFWLVAGCVTLVGGFALVDCAKAGDVIDNTDPDGSVAGVDSAACPDADVSLDPNNCGGCGHKCAAGQVCSGGACKAECDVPTVKCPKETACIDVTKDPKHCGACTTVCTVADAGDLAPGDGNPEGGTADAGPEAGAVWDLGTPSCAASACTITCDATKQNCGGICFDVSRAHDHCGDCKTACPVDQACGAGHCCPIGQAYCNGACVDVSSDAKNCGSCGFACQNGMLCSGGQCTNLLGSGTDVDPWHILVPPAACVDYYNKFGIAAKDGVYTTSPKGMSINVYCDMTNKGVTYESFGMGQYSASYPGWTLVGAPDFSGSTQFDAAFSYLYNRDFLVNISPGWNSSNCCFINTTKTNWYGLATTSYMYPGLASSSSFNCNGTYNDPKYRLWLAGSSTIKASYTPNEAGMVTVVSGCGVGGNPAIFVKRY